MWSKLWIYAAIPIVFDCKQTVFKQVMEKSEEVLVLTGLVAECMAYTTFFFYFLLHSCLVWSVNERSNKVNQKLPPFLSQLEFTEAGLISRGRRLC